MRGKVFTYVSPAFLCGFTLMVVLFVAVNLSEMRWFESGECSDCGFSAGIPYEIYSTRSGAMNWGGLASDVLLMVLTGIWLGTVFWFGWRYLKALLKKEFAFALGSVATLAIFIALNVRSYIVENAAHVASRSGFSFSFSHDGFFWGFPLPWFYDGTCFPCDIWGGLAARIINWFSAMGVAWLIGILLKRFVQARRLK